MVSKTVGGVFAGYNWQKGNWVFGGEWAYSNPDQAAGSYPISVSGRCRCKLRAGLCHRQSNDLWFVGLSWSTFDDAGIIFEQSGANYGIGIDYALGKHAVLGLEYLERDLSGGNPSTSNIIENNASSISARLSWKF